MVIREQVIEPSYHDVLVIPTPGLPGKDGAPGKEGRVVFQEAMKFTQNTPASTWIIYHKLPQPITSCHIVSGGDPVMVSWIEKIPGEVHIFFASPCSGEVTIS